MIIPACPQTLKPMPMACKYKRGDSFKFESTEFVVLDCLPDIDTGVYYYLTITKEPLWPELMRFGETNDWRFSDIYKKIINEYELPDGLTRKDLAPIKTDLIADDGNMEYGFKKDYVSILTADSYRAYRKWIPKYKDWVWTATPWNIYPGYAGGVRHVYADGSLDYGGAYLANGLVPGLFAIEMDKVEEAMPKIDDHMTNVVDILKDIKTVNNQLFDNFIEKIQKGEV